MSESEVFALVNLRPLHALLMRGHSWEDRGNSSFRAAGSLLRLVARILDWGWYVGESRQYENCQAR
jgi:hypothetical protein